jgi:mono/diheme cytochrome c family protein
MRTGMTVTYGSVGDAENHRLSLDHGKFGGKILRMTAEGEPCDDNPWFAHSPTGSPGKFLFAIGLRNVFDLDFQPATGCLYGVDNGKNIDRLVEVRRGASYGWNGDFNSTRLNALWTWGPVNNTAPVGMLFLHRPVLGDHSLGRCYVATYGPPGALGETHGKSLWEFIVAADSGLLATTPTVILRYRGTKQATVLGLAEGPDGIYFTDFFGESAGEPESPVGNVWRLAPSVATASTPSGAVSDTAGLTPAERGERTFLRNCTPCHRLDGVGGGEGPDLTYLHEDLLRRLGSPGYQSLLEKLLKDEGEFFVRQRPRLRAVREAVDEYSLLKIWLKHHIEEPRFDNPFSKMPGFSDAISETQREEIIDFLMARSGIPSPPAPPE